MNDKPRFLFNSTTNVVGGGVQNAANFVHHAMRDVDVDWFFAVSKQVFSVLQEWGVKSDRIWVCESSPARSRGARQALKSYAGRTGVTLVYTMAGPAYVDFDQVHVLGISEPYLTTADFQGFVIGRSFGQVLKAALLTVFKGYYARRANYWVFQTASSRDGFCRRLHVDPQKTAVVPNALGEAFASVRGFTRPAHTGNGVVADRPVMVLCPAAAYPHKCLHIIPDVAKGLSSRLQGIDFRFVLTIDLDSDLWKGVRERAIRLGVEGLIENVGPFSYAQASQLYSAADLVFVPSVLEVFSTTYLEAIAMEKPLVVADKSFAREICGEAAVYVRSASVDASVRGIESLLTSEKLRQKVLSHGEETLLRYGTYERRYTALTEVLRGCARSAEGRQATAQPL